LTFVAAQPSARPSTGGAPDGFLTPDLLVDADVADAMGALAATYETAARGVLYEHRPTSLPAQRLLDALAPVLGKAGERGGSAFEREAAVVLRRVEAAARPPAGTATGRRVFLDLVARVVEAQAQSQREAPAASQEDAAPRVTLT